jgi:hypothetical protein
MPPAKQKLNENNTMTCRTIEVWRRYFCKEYDAIVKEYNLYNFLIGFGLFWHSTEAVYTWVPKKLEGVWIIWAFYYLNSTLGFKKIGVREAKTQLFCKS